MLPYARGSHFLMPRMFLIPCLLVLLGCTGAGTPYTDPWAQAKYQDRSLSLYSSPWNAPFPEPTEPPPYPVTPEGPFRKPDAQVPLEPIGPWASRHVAPLGEPVAFPDQQPPSHAEVLPPRPQQGAEIAAKAEGRSQPATEARPISVASLSGRWALRTGRDTCQIQLSTSSTLDLYKASTSRCQDAALREVNTWILRGHVIELYSKGRVVAHLQPNGSTYTGLIENRGLPVTMTR